MRSQAFGREESDSGLGCLISARLNLASLPRCTQGLGPLSPRLNHWRVERDDNVTKILEMLDFTCSLSCALAKLVAWSELLAVPRFLSFILS